jgi:hypothetical protein
MSVDSRAITADSESAPWYREARTTFYLLIVVVSIVAAFVFKLRVDGAFACQASGYGATAYLSDCTAANYGDYDHGAFWFGLEPDASRAVAQADVLFVGNSRLQFALSGAQTTAWFSAASIRHYLLGFSHSENVMYMGPLLSRIGPHAKVYVINVDRFFDDRISPPMAQILQGRDVLARYKEKRWWQVLHKTVCGGLPILCGDRLGVYRDRGNGTWRKVGAAGFQAHDVSDGAPSNTDRWPQYAALGEKFIKQLGVERRCVILMLVPTVETKRAEATALADALGMELLSPRIENLHTFDGSHLDAASAQRWSAAFLEVAGPRIRQCMAGVPKPGPAN